MFQLLNLSPILGLYQVSIWIQWKNDRQSWDSESTEEPGHSLHGQCKRYLESTTYLCSSKSGHWDPLCGFCHHHCPLCPAWPCSPSRSSWMFQCFKEEFSVGRHNKQQWWPPPQNLGSKKPCTWLPAPKLAALSSANLVRETFRGQIWIGRNRLHFKPGKIKWLWVLAPSGSMNLSGLILGDVALLQRATPSV